MGGAAAVLATALRLVAAGSVLLERIMRTGQLRRSLVAGFEVR